MRLSVESMASVFSDCISITVFQFPHIRLKVGFLLVKSFSNRLACISSNEQQEHILCLFERQLSSIVNIPQVSTQV